jgi:hypothetical protein
VKRHRRYSVAKSASDKPWTMWSLTVQIPRRLDLSQQIGDAPAGPADEHKIGNVEARIDHLLPDIEEIDVVFPRFDRADAQDERPPARYSHSGEVRAGSAALPGSTSRSAVRVQAAGR